MASTASALTSASVPSTDYKGGGAGDLQPGTEYVVSVQDVLSSTGHLPVVRAARPSPRQEGFLIGRRAPLPERAAPDFTTSRSDS